MAVKNFLFKGNWVGGQVAGMKTTFTIFEPTWTHILVPKDPRNSLNSILDKKDRSYNYQFYDFMID